MSAGLLDCPSLVRRFWPRVVPRMTHAMHKGSCGRIAVVGGSLDYSGAPYFAAISAMHAGADLAYVLCPPEAALAIKAYSPDLCVRPLLSDDAIDECLRVVSSCHAVVIGPGVGDGTEAMRERLLPAVVRHTRECGIPLVVDTSVMAFPAVLARLRAHAAPPPANSGAGTDASPVYLTPNGREILLLAEAAVGADAAQRFTKGDIEAKRAVVAATAQAVRAVVALKGYEDFVVDGWTGPRPDGTSDATAVGMLRAGTQPSPRRAAGQGDVFAGTLGCFAAWAKLAGSDAELPPLIAPCCASLVVREAALTAFEAKGRSLLASDVCANVGRSMAVVDAAMSANAE